LMRGNVALRPLFLMSLVWFLAEELGMGGCARGRDGPR
jgi:hypothetical protein